MNDRELLELAAKAAGMTWWRDPKTDSAYWGDAHERYICSVWNPLTDDGDALRLAEEGLPNKEIARRLDLSPGTVRNYLSDAAGKLGAANRIEAGRIARANGWL